MTPIPPSDAFLVRAAEGWLGLGNPIEARAELDQVSAGYRDHPVVLDAGWSVCAASGDWEGAHHCGEAMVRLHPALLSGWIHRAYATRRMRRGGLQSAKEALEPAVALFPEEPMVTFNMACYLAQLGAEEESWRWYQETLKRGDAEAIRASALEDEDLRPIWPRIRG
jgi:tetratricopeptide (TPR) repeat protein